MNAVAELVARSCAETLEHQQPSLAQAIRELVEQGEQPHAIAAHLRRKFPVVNTVLDMIIEAAHYYKHVSK